MVNDEKRLPLEPFISSGDGKHDLALIKIQTGKEPKPIGFRAATPLHRKMKVTRSYIDIEEGKLHNEQGRITRINYNLLGSIDEFLTTYNSAKNYKPGSSGGVITNERGGVAGIHLGICTENFPLLPFVSFSMVRSREAKTNYVAELLSDMSNYLFNMIHQYAEAQNA
ncbi:hypothetical protein HYV83_05555 [Candidatus Woesearchaeota archaeon]|nr:hypothetical protein [Candidatus Woesearchaeota archaeon]